MRADDQSKREAGPDGDGRDNGAVPLDSLARGTEARVYRVGGEGPVARRLMEMGIVPGAPVSVVRAAPFGDPIEVRIRGYHLALRRSEASTIQVISDE